MIISNSTFSENSAQSGGSFYLSHNFGNVTIENSIFTNNIANSIDYIFTGGGVFYFKGTDESILILINNSFISNNAYIAGAYCCDGGVIYEEYSIYISISIIKNK